MHIKLFSAILLFAIIPLQAQQRVIFDTDIDSDVDDVGALAMLHRLHNQYTVSLKGVIVTSDDPYAPTCVDALNTYYGCADLPIGFLEDQPKLTNHSRYTKQISEEFPHRLGSYKDAEPATRLYRRLLAESPDNSVIIVTAGHLSSLQKLLMSPADDLSPLNGKALAEAKVQKWYCMGGQFPEGKEANFYRPDPASTVYCLQHWPRPAVFCGWEVGNRVKTGGQYVKSRLDAKHPVYRAYQLYNDFKGRSSWDQLAVFLLTDDAEKYFRLEDGGQCSVAPDGSNKWMAGEKSNQCYMVFKDGVDPVELERKIDDMMTDDGKMRDVKARWEGRSADFSHGRLMVHESRRFLCHADGTPFFYLGDTAWELFHRASDEETDIYLEDRRGKGFNVVQAVILAEEDGLNFPDRYGNRPLKDNDPTRPDPAYFDRVDRVIRKAEAKGIYIGLLPTWGDKVDKRWGKGPVVFNESNAFVYGQYLGKRYKDFPNIIWICGGDRSGGGDNTAVWDAMAAGIRSADKNHLMTFHPIGYNTSSAWFHDRDWLDFNSCQTGHAHYDYTAYQKFIAGDYQKQPAKPVINMEPCYEDHPIRGLPPGVSLWFDAVNVRQALYWSLFSGACGHTYGCHPIWQWMAPDRKPVGLVRNNWYDDLDLPGANDMIHARRLMESYDFFSRTPAPEIIATPQTTPSDAAVAVRGKGYAFVYLPGGNKTEVSAEKIPGAGRLKLYWFDPRTGEKTFIESIPAKGTYTANPQTSGRGCDWVLIMEAE